MVDLLGWDRGRHMDAHPIKNNGPAMHDLQLTMSKESQHNMEKCFRECKRIWTNFPSYCIPYSVSTTALECLPHGFGVSFSSQELQLKEKWDEMGMQNFVFAPGSTSGFHPEHVFFFWLPWQQGCISPFFLPTHPFYHSE